MNGSREEKEINKEEKETERKENRLMTRIRYSKVHSTNQSTVERFLSISTILINLCKNQRSILVSW